MFPLATEQEDIKSLEFSYHIVDVVSFPGFELKGLPTENDD